MCFRLWTGWISILLAVPMLAGSTSDGMFAKIQTTAGEVFIDLQVEEAPRTCANLVSLAEGTRERIDSPAAQITSRHLFDRFPVHRAASNSWIHVIQTGSPMGLGHGGPGYRFKDDVRTNLRHDVEVG